MRKTYSAKTLLLLGSLAAATAARAQDAPRVQNKVLGANGQPELVRFAAGKAAYRGTADGEQLLRQQLALGTDDKMLPTRAETDELGFFHQKYAQYYKGIRVEHADYTVHAKGGALESISGDYEDVKGLSTAPALNAEAALRRALIFVGARKYMCRTPWKKPA